MGVPITFWPLGWGTFAGESTFFNYKYLQRPTNDAVNVCKDLFNYKYNTNKQKLKTAFACIRLRNLVNRLMEMTITYKPTLYKLTKRRYKLEILNKLGDKFLISKGW